MQTRQTQCVNPATGEVLGASPENTVEELRKMIAQARSAQTAWAERPIGLRSRAMLRVRDYIVDHADELSEIISRDNGKTCVDAISTEVLPAALAADYYSKKAKRFLRTRRLAPSSLIVASKRSRVRQVPWGVIGVISPWNCPFSIPFSEVVMGLLAGNAVILKVATPTQMVGRALERCFQAAELPEGVFSYLNLPGRVAGNALLENGIDKIFFTGAVATGKQLMAKAAETLTPVSLELGGNDAMLVCRDADWPRAAAGAVWSRDRKTACHLARRIQAGAVTINNHLVSHGLAETPWGGFKESSLGRTHGAIGFAEMTQPQCIIDDLMPGARRDIWWHPHNREVYRDIRALIDMLFARRISTRFLGFCRSLRAFARMFRD